MTILIIMLLAGIALVIGGYFIKTKLVAYVCLAAGLILIAYSAIEIVGESDSQNHPIPDLINTA